MGEKELITDFEPRCDESCKRMLASPRHHPAMDYPV